MKEIKNNKAKSPVLMVNLIILGVLLVFGTYAIIVGRNDFIPGSVAFMVVGFFYVPSVIIFNIIAYFVKRKTQSKVVLVMLFLIVYVFVIVVFREGATIYYKIQSKKPRQESEACLKAWASKDGIQLKSFTESPIYNEQGKIKGLKIDLEIQNDTEYSDGLQVSMSSGGGPVSVYKARDEGNSTQTINNLKPYQLNKITYILDTVSFDKYLIEGRENEKIIFNGWIRLVAGGVHIFYDPNYGYVSTDRKCNTVKGRDDMYFEEVLRPFPMTSREYKVSDFVETPGIIQ